MKADVLVVLTGLFYDMNTQEINNFGLFRTTLDCECDVFFGRSLEAAYGPQGHA